MFSGELPKLFDRNFILGYLLPVTLFAVANYGLLRGFGFLPDPTSLSLFEQNPWLGTTIIALVLWLIAVLLLVTNRFIYQVLEGYYFPNALRLLEWREKRRYKRLQKRMQAVLEKEPTPEEIHPGSNWYDIKYDQVEQFPPETHLLPTRFGNAMRAWELYPWEVYGIDAVEGWNRLATIIPKDYQSQMDDAKAQTDFWVNLWVLSLLTVVGYMGSTAIILIVGSFSEHLYMLWFLPALLLFPFLASWGARKAAIEWGNYVKAAFDVFLPELARKLGFPPNLSYETEKKLWDLYRRAITYRLSSFRAGFVQELSKNTDTITLALDLAKQLLPNRLEAQELGSKLQLLTQNINSLREELEEEERQLTERKSNGPASGQ